MKLPKKVIICGQDYKVIRKKKLLGGYFKSGNQEIGVGTNLTPQHILETFLHEVIEAILTERNLRYQLGYSTPDNGDYLFSFTHKDLENLVKDIQIALKGVLK